MGFWEKVKDDPSSTSSYPRSGLLRMGTSLRPPNFGSRTPVKDWKTGTDIGDLVGLSKEISPTETIWYLRPVDRLGDRPFGLPTLDGRTLLNLFVVVRRQRIVLE